MEVFDDTDTALAELNMAFSRMSVKAKECWLAGIVEGFDNHLLNFVHHLVSPMLKKDPFQMLPNELCFKVITLYAFLVASLKPVQILEFVDDPKTFVRASQVSRRWREILGDDQAWKTLCEKHAYRRMSTDSIGSTLNSPPSLGNSFSLDQYPRSSSPDNIPAPSSQNAASQTAFVFTGEHVRKIKRPRPRSTHRLHFKHRYLVESAWKKGGRMTWRHITPDQGVVTSLHLTKKYIVLALDNAKIHVFDVKGDHQRTLQGHVMGVWAMVPWGDILVSGGCDRDVRVWNMATGYVFMDLCLQQASD